MSALIDGLDGLNRADGELARIGCPTGEVDDSGSTAAARIDVVTIDINQAFDGLVLLDRKVDPGTTVNVHAVVARASFGTFMERYSPEWVAAFLTTMRVAHARLAEQTLIAAMTTLSTATTQAGYLGASRDLLEAVEQAAVAVRSRHRLADGAVIRVVLPLWARGMIRADLTRALPGDLRTAVSDAEIGQHFAVRSINPVWSLDGQVFAAQAAGVLLAWPATVDMLVYPEGAFLHLDGGVLDLGLVRSPELNAVNQVESFAETFEAVALVGAQSLRITATVEANGATAGTVIPF